MPVDNNRITASGPQQAMPGEDNFGLVEAGVAASAIAGLGFIPTKTGRVWDQYLNVIRAVESGFPGGVMKTFRLSEYFSVLESWDKGKVDDSILREGGHYADYMRTTFGSTSSSINAERTGAIFGDVSSGGKKIGLALNIESGTQKGSGIADYYARIQGTKLGREDSLSESILRSDYKKLNIDIPFKDWKKSLTPLEKKRQLLLGARFRENINVMGKNISLSTGQQRLLAKAEIGSKLLRAKAASTAGRLNNLLTKPFEIPVIGDVLHKIPLIRDAGIDPGTSTQMLGRYVKKGMILGAAYKGLSYYDYLRSEGDASAVAIGGLSGAAAGGLLFNKPGVRFSKMGAGIGAAVGLYTALAPRFDDGLFHGVASMFTDAAVGRAEVSEALGISDSLRNQEEVTPGLVSAKTAIGFAGVGALTAGFSQYGKFLYKAGKTKIQDGGALGEIFDNTRHSMQEGYGDLWETGIGKKIASTKPGKYLSKIKNPYALGAIAGLAAWTGISSGLSLLSGNVSAAIPGLNLLGTADDPEQLKRMYSGEEDVAVRKGRWWEFGRSSGYEGGKIEYYRPHMIHRMKTRAFEKGLYGSEEEKWDHDPLLNPMKALFGSDDWKYHYDDKYAKSRPAPLTSTYGDDIPFIGSLISATIGKLLKPRKTVREDEWNLGGGEYKHLADPRPETEPDYELGGLKPGAPVAPDSASQLLNELNYRRREAVGLVGFAEGALEKAFTGREEAFQNKITLDTMGKETGSEYWLWSHLNVGGAMGTSEVVRRFIPHTRSYLDTYNPLENDMPSWMPNDYFMDLKHGNPFDKIKEAEIRLPGEGYAALNPDMAGVAPEDYSMMHRLKILGDVAMWSKEYKNTLSQAKAQRGNLSERDKQLLDRIQQQVKSKKIKKEFQEYNYDSSQLKSRRATITDIINPTTVRTKELGDMNVQLQGIGKIADQEKARRFAEDTLLGQTVDLVTPSLDSRGIDLTRSGGRQKAVAMVRGNDYGEMMVKEGLAEHKALQDEFRQIRFSGAEKMAGRISENILHGMDSPLEMLTPMSPASKMIRQRSAVEDYVKTQAIGTGNAFWDKPIENFLSPAKETAEYSMGDSEIPKAVQKRRAIDNYFDMLKWAKAKKTGDRRAEIETMFGADVFASPQNVMRALPRAERDYFQAFSDARSDEERQEILSLVPENAKRIYKSVWLRQEEQTSRAKKEAKIAQQKDDQVLAATAKARISEGFEISPELEKQWMSETGGKIPFDDWIRQKKANQYFATHSLPGADWLGWHPSVDMDDVKLKYVQNAGLDHHDFDLWGDRLKSLARKPYISDELVAELDNAGNLNNDEHMELASRATANIFSDGSVAGQSSSRRIDADIDSSYNIEIKDSRTNMIGEAYRSMGVG